MTHPEHPFPTPREGLMRRVPSGAMVASTALVTADVYLAKDATVWFHTVIRGDDGRISVGERTNIQDGCILHCDTGIPLVIGKDCTIGHGAIIHGAKVGDGVLIGMGSTLLGRSVIGDGAVVAAGSLVKEGFEVPPNTLVAGVPAKIIRDVSKKEQAFMAHAVPHYVETALSYLPKED